MKIFYLVLAAATVIGGFVGGELTDSTFLLTGAVIGGVGTAAVLLGLGAFFSAQEEKQKAKIPPEVRGVFDRMLTGTAACPKPKKPTKEESFINVAADALEPQLAAAGGDSRTAFPLLIRNLRGQGYVFGVLDALLQTLDLRRDHTAAKTLMESFYKKMFGESAGFCLLNAALTSQDNPEFHKGRLEGGRELDFCLNMKTPPSGLKAILRGDEPAVRDRAAAPVILPTPGEFDLFVHDVELVFRKFAKIPSPSDTIAKVLQRNTIYRALLPFAYGLTSLRFAEASSDFIESSEHEDLRRMVENKLTRINHSAASCLADSVPRIPGLSLQPDSVQLRQDARVSLQVALQAIADGQRLRQSVVARANLVQLFASAPFLDTETQEALLSEIAGFVEVYLRYGPRR